MSAAQTERQLSLPLLASLLLNALLIGILAAHWFKPDGRPEAHRLPAGLPSIHALARGLDANSRRDLRQQFGKHRKAIRSALQAARASRQEVAIALEAEPFSGEMLATAFAHQRQADTAMAAAIQRVLLAFARDHSLAERRTLLRAMSRDGRGRGERRPAREEGAHPTGRPLRNDSNTEPPPD